MENIEKQETNFDHAPTRDELVEIYRQSKKADPASMEYKRVLVRPSLHMKRVCLLIVLVVMVAIVMSFIAYMLFESISYAITACVAVIFLSLIIFAKQVLIWLVKVYQRFASEKTRNRCRYEPSCSQYMIIALQKYGFFKGVSKGIRRLLRCRPPNGGIDVP